MLELDNLDLDLDLDDDFPSGPLNKINLFGSNFSNSLPWDGKSTKQNLSSDKSRGSENFEKADFLFIESSAFKEESDKSFANSKNTFGFDENELNPAKDISTHKRVLLHRKFPGPAGLLPDKPLKDLPDVNIIVDDSTENVNSEQQRESIILCSQTASVFSEASYKKLASDFDLFEENCPLHKYNIAWVKKKALQKSFKGKKIPFLAVVLHHLDHSTPDPVLKLTDHTGEIHGILHREVWSDLGGKLHPGAALALRQVGVLITWTTKRQIYLNITVNNILNIYSYSDKEVLERSCINNLEKSDLLKDIEIGHSETEVSKMNSPLQPFSTLGSKILNYASGSSVKDSKCTTSSKTCETKKVAFPNRIHTGNILPGNKLNNLLLTDGDICDFMESVDEDSVFDEFLGETDNCDFNVIIKNEQYEGNCRKRKLETDVKNSLNTSEDKLAKSDFSVPPPKLGNAKYREKFIADNEPANQLENHIAEEALDGIDFDDFSDFGDFEI